MVSGGDCEMGGAKAPGVASMGNALLRCHLHPPWCHCHLYRLLDVPPNAPKDLRGLQSALNSNRTSDPIRKLEVLITMLQMP